MLANGLQQREKRDPGAQRREDVYRKCRGPLHGRSLRKMRFGLLIHFEMMRRFATIMVSNCYQESLHLHIFGVGLKMPQGRSNVAA